MNIYKDEYTVPQDLPQGCDHLDGEYQYQLFKPSILLQ